MRKLRLAAFAAVSVSAIAAVYLTVGARGAFVAALMLVCYFKRQTILPLALVACWAFMSRALGFLTAHTPHTLDATLWRLDLRLGYSPAVAMAAVGSSPSLLWITTHAYWEGLLGAVVVAALAGPRPWEFIANALSGNPPGHARRLVSRLQVERQTEVRLQPEGQRGQRSTQAQCVSPGFQAPGVPLAPPAAGDGVHRRRLGRE